MRLTVTKRGLISFILLAILLPFGVLAIVLHECGHLLMAFICKVKVKELGLCAKGAFIRRSPADSHHEELLIASAGIATNLLLAMTFHGTRLATINCAVALVNVIPFLGSDGQRILQTIKSTVSRSATALSHTLPKPEAWRAAL